MYKLSMLQFNLFITLAISFLPFFVFFKVHSKKDSKPVLSGSNKITYNQLNEVDNIINNVTLRLYDYDVVVIGAGLSGATIAERHSKNGERVLVIDKRNHIAGNCFDYVEEDTGIRVSKYGIHLFHTNNEDVWKYVTKFSSWQRWDHKVLGWINKRFVPIPVNINTVNALFNLNISGSDEMRLWLKERQKLPVHGGLPLNSEEMAISRVGEELYELIFESYTQKQWDVHPTLLDASVTGRIPVRDNFDDRYFTDRYQALPVNGYTSFIEAVLNSPNVTVKLNTDFFDIPNEIVSRMKKIYYTGPIDQFFGQKDALEYRSLSFERIVYKNHVGTVLPVSQVNYPSLDFPYTRIVEYKHILNQQSKDTVVFKEFSSGNGEPYYPVPTQKNRDRYEELLAQTNKFPNVVFVGRLANYKYFNMDEAIYNAIQTFNIQTRVAHVVVTKFNEDINWLSEVCLNIPKVKVSWFVYLKNPGIELNSIKQEVSGYVDRGPCVTKDIHVIDQRENVGREGLAWSSYLFSDYVIHGSVHVFLQGRIETNVIKVTDFIKNTIALVDINKHYEPFHPIFCGGENWRRVDFFAKEYDFIVVDQLKYSNECLHYRAEFGVTLPSILNFVQRYRDLFNSHIFPAINISNDPPMIHVLERMWMPMLKT